MTTVGPGRSSHVERNTFYTNFGLTTPEFSVLCEESQPDFVTSRALVLSTTTVVDENLRIFLGITVNTQAVLTFPYRVMGLLQ